MHNNHFRFWLAALLIAIVTTSLVSSAYIISLIHIAAIAALLAASMRFVMLIGELNFASSAFVAVGAYCAGSATTLLDLPFPMAFLLGPVLVTALSILFGLVTLRAKGPYFMLIGFAFSEAIRIIFTKIDVIGAVSGMAGIFPPPFVEAWMPTFVVVTVILFLFVLYAAEKSDFGKTLIAIRDNEEIARTVGINVLLVKVTCFAIASFCDGIAGSLFAFVNTVISPGDFSFILASFALAYIKIGGENSIFGAVTGAILISLLGSFSLAFGAGENFIYGGAIVLAMLLMPKGIFGLIAKYWRPRLGATSHGQSHRKPEVVA